MRRDKAALAIVLALFSAASLSAQPPPATSEPEPTTLRERLSNPDQAGGIHLTKHLAVVFGGIKPGSGIALGPALSDKLARGGFVQIKGEYSIKNFKLLQARYDSPRFWSDRAALTSRLRWQDAPELPLYLLGPDSPNARADYGERKTEGSVRIDLKASPAIRMASGFGIERYATTGGRLELKEGSEALREIPSLPGLGAQATFAHLFASVAFDTRSSPDYSRSGRFAEAGIHEFHTWHEGQDSFRRAEATAQQLWPTHRGRGVVDVSARAWLSIASADRAVPFFLMPTLGGGEWLRAFPSYRFRDRDALLLRGEYRWAIHEMADVAGVYEAGKVARTVKGLAFAGMAQSIAVGIRVHSTTSTLLRADLAHGREGLGFRLGFSAAGR